MKVSKKELDIVVFLTEDVVLDNNASTFIKEYSKVVYVYPSTKSPKIVDNSKRFDGSKVFSSYEAAFEDYVKTIKTEKKTAKFTMLAHHSDTEIVDFALLKEMITKHQGDGVYGKVNTLIPISQMCVTPTFLLNVASLSRSGFLNEEYGELGYQSVLDINQFNLNGSILTTDILKKCDVKTELGFGWRYNFILSYFKELGNAKKARIYPRLITFTNRVDDFSVDATRIGKSGTVLKKVTTTSLVDKLQ